MRLLIDSHILLWYANDDARLSQAAAKAIQNAGALWFSAASVWELALKMHTGKLPVQDVVNIAARLRCELLPVTAEHAKYVLQLDRIHRDPFDQLLLAQAQVEDLTLVTHDRILAAYGVPVILV